MCKWGFTSNHVLEEYYFSHYIFPSCLLVAVINVTIYPGSHQVEESDTTVVFNVSRNDDVILDRNVSVRVSTKAATAGGNNN